MEQDDRGINEARGYACEIVAWRFLTHLSESDLIDYLLHELPPVTFGSARSEGEGESTETGRSHSDDDTERARLLWDQDLSRTEEPLSSFVGLNALEIATVANAKRFLSQRVVQKVVNDIWNGHIVFWESLSIHGKKKAKMYNKR